MTKVIAMTIFFLAIELNNRGKSCLQFSGSRFYKLENRSRHHQFQKGGHILKKFSYVIINFLK